MMLPLAITMVVGAVVLLVVAREVGPRLLLEFGIGRQFRHGITVTSSGDRPDADLGDGRCDDGEGVCTLRAALQESNFAFGVQTIRFRVTGAADFLIGGEPGYVIRPRSDLPDITDSVIIQGASQPGSRRNTAPAPQPLNGRHLIAIDGGGTFLRHALVVGPGAGGSSIDGLVIGGFGHGDAVKLQGADVALRGNYIGTDPTGTIARPNGVGVNNGGRGTSRDARIGGLHAGDRNLVAGNTDGGSATAAYPQDGWTIQGNYFGVASDGVTPIANGTSGGSGILSIDDCRDVTVGGSSREAGNVFGEGLGHGIAPHNARSVRIEGNIIGTSHDESRNLGNLDATSRGSGVALSASRDVVIRNNVIQGWRTSGVYVGRGSRDIRVETNHVQRNGQAGIFVEGAADVVAFGNVIKSNDAPGMQVWRSDGIQIIRNVIQGNAGPAIVRSLSTNVQVRRNILS